jgi:hypothetical protein
MVAILYKSGMDIRATMHAALDQELDRELAADNLRSISVSVSVGLEEVLTAKTLTERIPQFEDKSAKADQ